MSLLIPMLNITVPKQELWDEEKQIFITVEEKTITLEHSLISISKWESKWHKSFLTNKNKTQEEVLDYMRCMCITPKVDPMYFRLMTPENLKDVENYIADSNTAVWFPPEDENEAGNKESVTSELIYYWMISNQIPFDPCEKWHLNKLLALIRVCSIKNTPPEKLNKSQIAKRNRALNAARCKKYNTKG